VVDLNNQAARVFGRSREDVIGRDICEILAMDRVRRESFRERLESLDGSGIFDFHFEEMGRRFLIRPLRVSTEDIILFFVEITYRQKAEDAVRIHEVLFDKAQDIILFVDMSGQIVNANEKACESYGYTKDELRLLGIEDIRHPSAQAFFQEQMGQADEDGVVFESIHVRSDGTVFPVEVSAKSTETERGKIRIHIIRNITERREHEEKIAWLARYDGLTGILNRRSFIAELDEEMKRAQRKMSKFAVLLFDIDRFKLINDSHGHATGDYILALVAKRVKAVLRENDQVGRLGGDEFVVLQTDIQTEGDVVALVERIFAALSQPVSYEGAELVLSISLGASLFPDHATDTAELMHYADQAMYHTKRNGPNGYSLYRPDVTY
jgi:diguanylate cyclase (GGDEF)-like protein/PAS domain S-box-containing protein